MVEQKAVLRIGVFCVLIAILVSCGSHSTVSIDTTGFVSNINRNMAQTGEVRLIYDGSTLYETGVQRLFAQKCVALSGDEKSDSYASVFSKTENAYVTDAVILYYQSHDYQKDLYCKERETGKVVCIAKDVAKLIQIDGSSIYFCKKNNAHFNADTLWKYDLETKARQSILEEVSAFCVNDGILYTVSCPTSAIAIADEYRNTLRAYDLKTMEMLLEDTVPLQFAALNMQVAEDQVILWSLRGRMYVYSVPAKDGGYLAYPIETEYGGIKVALNSFGSSIYASIVVNRFTEMDSLAVETSKLGTWRYDFQSQEWLKLSDKVYDALYVFDASAVYGVVGNAVYQIKSDGTSEWRLET